MLRTLTENLDLALNVLLPEDIFFVIKGISVYTPPPAPPTCHYFILEDAAISHPGSIQSIIPLKQETVRKFHV